MEEHIQEADIALKKAFDLYDNEMKTRESDLEKIKLIESEPDQNGDNTNDNEKPIMASSITNSQAIRLIQNLTEIASLTNKHELYNSAISTGEYILQSDR